MKPDIIVTVIFCLLSLAAAYIFVPETKLKKPYILLAFMAVVIRIAMVYYLYRGGADSFGTDGLLYHREGIKIARQLSDGIPFYSLKYSYTWYTVFVGLIYHIFGVNRYIASFINISLAYITAILLLKMALRRKYRFVNAAFISLAFLYFPNLFLWTTDSRKEALTIFICILCWYSVQSLIIRAENADRLTAATLMRIVFICLLIWIGTLVRIYLFVPLSAGILVSQLVLYLKSRLRLNIIFAAAVLIISFIIFISAVIPLTQDYHAVSFPKEHADSVTEDIANKAERIKDIASHRNVILSIVNYMLLPYPGNVDLAYLQANQNLKYIIDMDMIFWYICMLLMLTGIYSALRQKDSCFIGLLGFAAAYVLINALVAENVADTILRYRSVIIGLLLLFIDMDVLRNLFVHYGNNMRYKSGTAKLSPSANNHR